jgi:hypothetical protein
MAELQPDFKELLGLFSKHKVECLIVGAYAMAFHGAPRYTGDLDVMLNPTSENAERVLAALEEFGFGSLGLSPEDFIRPGQVVQLGQPPLRVDLLTSLTGLSWEQAFAGRQEGKFGALPVFFLGKKELVLNKKKLGRHKDLADIESLEG